MIAVNLCLVDAEKGGCVVTIFHPLGIVLAILILIVFGAFAR